MKSALTKKIEKALAEIPGSDYVDCSADWPEQPPMEFETKRDKWNWIRENMPELVDQLNTGQYGEPEIYT